ncbi:MAG: HD domain-containing protein [Magnetococcales bacterium]|nr:HD domain-containing protein [Magnetococcales bacterium]
MNLVAGRLLEPGEEYTVRHIPAGRCLCQHDNCKVVRFPDDNPEHVVCFHNASGQRNYCVAIPGPEQPMGLLYLQLQPGYDGVEEHEFLATLAGTLSGIIGRRQMEGVLAARQEELRKTRLDIIRRLGMAAEFRDQDTGQHVVRMSLYAVCLGRAAGLGEEECDNLLHAAPMHDVGKIGIPDHILLKPGRLDEQEWEIMRRHTIIGSLMLHGYDSEPMNTAHIIALTHHERWDGKGYPIGAPGEQIPIEGRICAIADVFDALTSARPYKPAWSVEAAVREIRAGAGTCFDPRLVEVFCAILPEILKVREAHIDS